MSLMYLNVSLSLSRIPRGQEAECRKWPRKRKQEPRSEMLCPHTVKVARELNQASDPPLRASCCFAGTCAQCDFDRGPCSQTVVDRRTYSNRNTNPHDFRLKNQDQVPWCSLCASLSSVWGLQMLLRCAQRQDSQNKTENEENQQTRKQIWPEQKLKDRPRYQVRSSVVRVYHKPR